MKLMENEIAESYNSYCCKKQHMSSAKLAVRTAPLLSTLAFTLDDLVVVMSLSTSCDLVVTS